MSVRVLTWVFEASKSTGADRLVLLAIADTADDNGRNAYPSTATIARKAAANNRTVQRALRNLTDLGELRVTTNAGPNGTNRYQVMVPKGWQRATPGGETPSGDTPPPRHDATPTPRQDAGVATDHRQDARGAATTTPRGGNTPPEPSLTQVTTTTAVGSRNAPAGTVPRIIRAYVEACRDASIPAPAEAQNRIDRSATSLIGQGYPEADLIDAARNAAVGGWTDLATQLQRDAARASPAKAKKSTTDERYRSAIDLAEHLEQKAIG